MSVLNLVESKIIDRTKISDLVKSWRRSSQKIVFTNGCFDVLHYGHVNYLAKAKDFGSKFVVSFVVC